MSNQGKICTSCGFGEYQKKKTQDTWYDDEGFILRCNNCGATVSTFYIVREGE
jgi:uncharacterized Zn finger protein